MVLSELCADSARFGPSVRGLTRYACLNAGDVVNRVREYSAGGSTDVRDRPKRLFLVTDVTETGAEIQLLVSAVTVTRPKLTNDLRP